MSLSNTSRSPIGIQSCPFEILVKIFLLLDARSKLSLRATCRFLASVFDSSSAIKYYLKLSVWGMVGASPSPHLKRALGRDPTLPHIDRLKTLDTHIHNFSTLQWTKTQTHIPVELINCVLQGGILVGISGTDEEELHLYELPSVVRGTTSIRHLPSKKLPFKTQNMAVDQSQDLAILFET